MKLQITLLIVLLISGCRLSTVPPKIQNDINSISKKYVPDSREGICDIKLSMTEGGKIVLKGETDQAEAKFEIIAYFTSSGREFSDSLTILPDNNQIKKSWGLVSISVSNIKKSPSHSSELVSQTIMGTPVKILKKKGGWLLIKTPDSYIGWANSSGISEMDQNEISKWKESERIIYLKKSGDILVETGKDGILCDIVSGSILEVTGKKNDFMEVVLPDGRKGLINKNDAADLKSWSASVLPDPVKMIPFAKAQLGTPYLWGGTSTKAFDCSGFVKTIYFTQGIILARDASQQFLHGLPVDYSKSLDSLKRGDLIFFGYKNEKGDQRITHVGMYIGDTEVIHCSGMVRINSLDSTRSNYSEYLKSGMQGARRIIGTGEGKGVERIGDHKWYF